MNKKYYLLLIPAFLFLASPAYAYPTGTVNGYSQYVCSSSDTDLGITGSDSDDENYTQYADLVSSINTSYSSYTGDWTSGSPPADFFNNPQNYCISGRSQQTGNPVGSAGSYSFKLYYGNSITPQANVGHTQYYAATYTVSAPTVTLTANPTSVVSGSASALSWTSTNATSCTSTNFASGNATSGGPVSTGALTTTTTYSIYCTGPGGTSPTSYATVTVTAPPAPTASLTANNPNLVSGNSTTFNYSCTNSTGGSASISPTIGAVALPSGTSGSVTPPVGTTTYTLTCTNSLGTSATSQATVTVTAALPDLIATVGPAITVTAGQPFTPSATITNQGSGDTSGSFENLLTVCDGNCAGYEDQSQQALGATLAANGFEKVSTSYTLNTPGTYYYLWTANENTSGQWGVSETSYGNNYSGWQIITVNPAIPPTPTGLTAACSTDGTHVSLSWNPTPGATSYYPRMYIPTAAQCTSYGWQVYSDGQTCIPNPDTGITPTSVPNFPITPGQTYSAWVHSANSSGINSTPDYLNNFSCSGQADLSANTPTAEMGSPGYSHLFSGVITNIGSATAPGGFENILQVCDSGVLNSPYACSSYDTVSNAAYISSSIPANTGTANVSYSQALPTTPGSYAYRWCANETAQGSNFVQSNDTESNYANNCSSWANLTVTTPSVSCSPNPNSALVGQNITWTATLHNFSGTPTYAWSDVNGTPSSGTASTFTDTYASAGNFSPNVSVTSGQYQSAGPTACTPVTINYATVSLTAVPDRVQSGATGVVLSWTNSGLNASNSCSIIGTNGFSASDLPISSSGYTDTNSVTGQTKYTITCNTGTVANPGTNISNTAIVNIVPKFVNF